MVLTGGNAAGAVEGDKDVWIRPWLLREGKTAFLIARDEVRSRYGDSVSNVVHTAAEG